MIAEKLRKSILQAAIQGKLTEQLPEDGDARDLLTAIKAEKARMIKEGKIKKEKPLPAITEDEIPFEIPENWCWVRLPEIGELERGKSKHRPRNDNILYENGCYPMIQTGDVARANRYITTFTTCYNEVGLAQSKLWRKGTLCLTIAANIGDVAILTFDACFPDSIVGFNAFLPINSNKYFLYMLSAYKYQLDNLSRSTAQKNINLEILASIPIPLPPLAEQQRIVVAIEEVLEEIEELKKDEIKLDLLQKSFPKKMKDSLLQAAIQGKLTEQLESDGDARDLVAEIQKEKERLIKEGKIKKEKPLPEIADDEIPFDIPENWCVTRLGKVAFTITDGTHSTPKYTTKGVPFLSVKDMSSGTLDFSNTRFVSQETHNELKKRCFPERNDLLITKVGTTGVPVIVETDEEFSLFVSVALVKYPNTLISPKYLKLVIKSPFVQQQVEENTRGVGNKNWVIKDIANTVIVLPPLAEQHRIVDRLEQLLPLCDALEQRI